MSSSIILVLCSTTLGFLLSLIVLILCQKIQGIGQGEDTKRIKKLRQKVDKILEQDNSPSGAVLFEETLEKASVTTSLQLPNLQNQAKVRHTPPEKYLILNNLARHGMKSDEIAAILGISSTEAAQLVSLHSIANIQAS